jgi:hypothetical protein
LLSLLSFFANMTASPMARRPHLGANQFGGEGSQLPCSSAAGSTFNPDEFGLTGSYIFQRHNPGDRVMIGEVNNGIACDDDATGRGFIM